MSAAFFGYPPDDPDEVATIVAALRSDVRLLTEAAQRLHTEAAPEWHSAGGDAALAEIARLAMLTATGVSALRTAASALDAYRAGLTRARARVDDLVRRYDAAQVARRRSGGWDAELPELTRERRAVEAELAATATETARALRAATARLGEVHSGRPGVLRLLAGRLPLWDRETARDQAAAAAGGLRDGLTPQRLAEVMGRYAAWQDNPVFATALTARLGPDRYRDLLRDAVPQSYDPATMAPTFTRYFGFLGAVLGAARLTPRWLDSLVAGLADPDCHLLRIGLGKALRHGRFRAGTLDRIAPALAEASYDHSLDVRHAFGDPMVGLLHALAGNAGAAQRFLSRDRIDRLLARVWSEDHGQALGALLAATSTLHTARSAAIAEDTVTWLGRHSRRAPPGMASGVGVQLSAFIDDVNHGLMDVSTAATMRENPLPVLSASPHAHFGQRDLAHALYVAMHSARGAASLYAHQAVYAAAQLSHAVERAGPSTTLAGIAVNYGRLSMIHELAVRDAAATDTSTEDERLRNSTAWIDMAATAVGLIPVPGLSRLDRVSGTVLGIGKGIAIGKIANQLEEKYYRKPLAAYSRRRAARAGTLADEEEAATRKYVDSLAQRLNFPADRWISSDLIGSGRDNVASELLPDLLQ